jgi:hypothetical protein
MDNNRQQQQPQDEDEQEDIKTKEQGKQTVTLPKGEEAIIERTAQKIPGKAKMTGHEKDNKNATIGEGTRSITRQVDGRTNKTQEHERQTKQTTKTTGEDNKEAGEIEQNTNGTPERNQRNQNKGETKK